MRLGFCPTQLGKIHTEESKNPEKKSIELRINSKIFRVISWSIFDDIDDNMDEESE